LHLPKSGHYIQRRENGGIGAPNITDALGYFFHGVLVDVGVLVEFPKVLYDTESLALFLWNAENGWVKEWVWSLNDPQFQPFIQSLFDELVMSFWNFELFLVDWILHFEVDFVLEILGQAQIISIDTECVLVLA
jgi:hypothetical protein